jgi:methionine-rich copper-binding protein CopC
MKLTIATLAFALALLVALAGATRPAYGHANYSSSTPGFGANVYPPAPTQVDAFFTQDLSLGGPNSLNVLGPGSIDFDNNDMVIDPGNHKHMTITLQGGLPFGAYTVQWTTTSVIDGHTGSGSFPFQYADPSAVGGGTSLAEVSIEPGGGNAGLLSIVPGAFSVILLAVGGALYFRSGRWRRTQRPW